MPQNHEKSEVISDRPTDRQTDIVNYRVALTRLKTLEKTDHWRSYHNDKLIIRN